MNRRTVFACCLLLLLSLNLYAGDHKTRAHKKHPAAKATLSDLRENDYDVKYVRFNLHVSDTSLFVAGDVSTTAQVTASSMSDYFFELDTLMIIDSAKINGVSLPVTTTGMALRKITLPAPVSAGVFFTAQIFYHGFPPPGGGFYNGLSHAVSAYGTHMVYNVSDPWVALVWWPCKQSAVDKIDSVDMFVTVPRGVVDGSNGILLSVDTTSTPGFWQYHWQTHYPITYYLVSIAVARYAEYKSYHHFSGSSDSMLIQNFFIDTATFNPAYKANFDSLGMIIDYFSSLFGRYPFWREKYGVCYTNLAGGMENQTMTTIGDAETYIIAHELCHQWFGDNVTYSRWGDVWLSEGFATYAEQLFLTHFWGNAAGLAHRKALLSSALSQECGEIFVTDTSGPTTIFFPPNVYNKAQGVINMLRYLAPADSMFFKVLRNYQDTFGLRNASTADLQAKFEHVYGFSLDTFFQQWIYGKGYPIYNMSWNQVGSKVYVKLIQTRSCAANHTTFHVPLQLQLSSPTWDTIVKVFNNADTQLYTITWPEAMDTIYFNPDIWTVCKLGTRAVHDLTLGVSQVITDGVKIFPNPTGGSWQIERLPANVRITLMDITGKVIWKGMSAKGTTIVPGEKLPTGDYFLRVGDNTTDSIKLAHW